MTNHNDDTADFQNLHERSQEPVTAEVVPTYGAESYPPSSSGQGCKWIAIGCGVTALIMLLVAGGIGFWAYSNANQLGAKLVVSGARAAIEESDLPPEQQEQLIERIEDVGERFAEGEVTLEQLAEVGEKLAQDEDVVTSGVVYVLENQVLEQAPIEEELRVELKRVVQRLARGVIEDEIDVEDLTPLLEEITVKTEDGFELKPDFAPEDFTKVLEAAKGIADEAEIPDEPYDVDFLEQVDEVIEEVIGQ